MHELSHYDSQSLALAAEAIRVTRTGNCTLFAVADSTCAWGFVPESFMGTEDWMFSAEGLLSSDLAVPVRELHRSIEGCEGIGNVSFKKISRGMMRGIEDRIPVMELVDALIVQVPELGKRLEQIAATMSSEKTSQ